jgi:hypothetical protein
MTCPRTRTEAWFRSRLAGMLELAFSRNVAISSEVTEAARLLEVCFRDPCRDNGLSIKGPDTVLTPFVF